MGKVVDLFLKTGANCRITLSLPPITTSKKISATIAALWRICFGNGVPKIWSREAVRNTEELPRFGRL
jgi:hypothetical protein